MWKGSYPITGPYKKNEIYIFEETADMVNMMFPPPPTFFGNIYICLEDHELYEWAFQSPKWQVFIPVAPQGQKGEKGATGATGSAGNLGKQWNIISVAR